MNKKTNYSILKKKAVLKMGLILIGWLTLFFAIPAVADTESGECTGFGDLRCPIAIEVHKTIVHSYDEDITRAAIGDPNIADIQVLTPRQIMIVAKNNPGVTNLVVWHGKDKAVIHDVRVFVSGNLIQAIDMRIRQLVPGAQVTVMAGRKGVLLDGTVASDRMLERVLSLVESFDVAVVNLLAVTGSRQVQLEVKIVEVSRSAAKQMGLGFLFQGDMNIGFFGNGSVSGGLSNSSDGARLGSDMELLPAFGSAFQLALNSLDNDFLGILSLMKGQGLARLLATPTLVTMSGQEAEFLVGGEFPIPVDSAAGGITVQFKSYGIILKFTPYVTGEETITIKVAPEVSNPDSSLSVSSGGVAVPGVKSRRGSTTLQLKDGQTFVMAGLIMEDLQSTVNKVPLLGDIPVLGGLFSSKEYQKNETELMVMVTPRLVRALNADERPVVSPSLEPYELNDVDFFLLNRSADADTPPGAAGSREPQSREAATTRSPVAGFVGPLGLSR